MDQGPHLIRWTFSDHCAVSECLQIAHTQSTLSIYPFGLPMSSWRLR